MGKNVLLLSKNLFGYKLVLIDKSADYHQCNVAITQMFVNNFQFIPRKFWNIDFLTTGCESPGAD